MADDTRVLEAVLTALDQDNESELSRIVSTTDWPTVPSTVLNKVLQRIGMYGFSGRTARYKTHISEILEQEVEPSLTTCAYLHLNDQAELLLQSNPALIHEIDDSGNTPIHAASERGNEELGIRLLSLGANVAATNQRGETPLALALHAGPWKEEPCTGLANRINEQYAVRDIHAAAQVGDANMIAALLDSTATEVNKFDEHGRTALFHACRNNHLEAVRILLDSGADAAKACKDDQTPLSTACLHSLSQECDLEIIELLLQYGAEESIESAVVRTNQPFIQRFFQSNPAALHDQDGESPLGYAIHTGNTRSLELLLELGAQPNEVNWQHIKRITAKAPEIQKRLTDLLQAKK